MISPYFSRTTNKSFMLVIFSGILLVLVIISGILANILFTSKTPVKWDVGNNLNDVILDLNNKVCWELIDSGFDLSQLQNTYTYNTYYNVNYFTNVNIIKNCKTISEAVKNTLGYDNGRTRKKFLTIVKEQNLDITHLRSKLLIYERVVKKCPVCGIMTEKISGCNHITCTQCNSHWCWNCKEIHEQYTIYRHLALCDIRYRVQ